MEWTEGDAEHIGASGSQTNRIFRVPEAAIAILGVNVHKFVRRRTTLSTHYRFGSWLLVQAVCRSSGVIAPSCRSTVMHFVGGSKRIR